VEMCRETGCTQETPPYLFLELYSSNRSVEINRKYKKLIEYFSDIGGIVEFLTFVVVFSYSWYNNMVMERQLINYGILAKEEDADIDQDGFVDLSEQNQSRFYSLSDVFKIFIKGLPCWNVCCCCFCRKKEFKEKAESYEQCQDALTSRMDVINLIKNLTLINIIKESLLDEHHLKLLPYLLLTNNDELGNMQGTPLQTHTIAENIDGAQLGISEQDERVKSMSIKDAIKRINEDQADSDIGKKLNAYIKANLPENLVNEDFYKAKIEIGPDQADLRLNQTEMPFG
jgi:hypothetical protein